MLTLVNHEKLIDAGRATRLGPNWSGQRCLAKTREDISRHRPLINRVFERTQQSWPLIYVSREPFSYPQIYPLIGVDCSTSKQTQKDVGGPKYMFYM